ncbi:Hypothetical predicted protein [Prunus dulcis]|uniref:Uncharacterized protein n=1 Tax=Prunus dulcis TaxID=3755 RepID=A0A5E4FD88_PRUDU|nr:Hypothetical predicted protein [Prunus dulcis]
MKNRASRENKEDEKKGVAVNGANKEEERERVSSSLIERRRKGRKKGRCIVDGEKGKMRERASSLME